jgi:hypothetical protein
MEAARHFPEPLNCLSQARAVLADGGIMYFADLCAAGTFSGTKDIVKKLKLSPFARFLLRPIIFVCLKKESHSASEVKSWALVLAMAANLMFISLGVAQSSN